MIVYITIVNQNFAIIILDIITSIHINHDYTNAFSSCT